MEIKFSMHGEPRGQGRARNRVNTSKRTGAVFAQTYKAGPDRDYEKSIHDIAEGVMAGRPPMEGALEAHFRFRLGIPKSYSKKLRARLLAGEEAHFGAYDLDNMVKSVLDAMNKVVFLDDKQIVRSTEEKIAHEIPGIDVKIIALAPQPTPEHTLTNRPEGALAPLPERSASTDRRRLAGGPSEKPAQIVSTQGYVSGPVGQDPECAAAATFSHD